MDRRHIHRRARHLGSTELIAELQTLYECIRFPVAGVGVIRWVENTVTEPSYFKLSTDSCPTHLATLDEVANVHPSLHQQILKLFESKQDELEILVQVMMKPAFYFEFCSISSLKLGKLNDSQKKLNEHTFYIFQLELRKMLLDRMINLLTRGCVVPVVKYIKHCCQKGDTDTSLIRYFVTEVLETITHPYSPEFVQLFLPMVENDEIMVANSMRGESGGGGGDNDPVSEFIGNYS